MSLLDDAWNGVKKGYNWWNNNLNPAKGFTDFMGNTLGGLDIKGNIDAYTGKAAADATLQANRENADLAREMYGRQRADALADWDRYTKYNSPEEVMNRYRQAGLNPNLIYGNAANSTSAMIRSSSASVPEMKPVINPKGGIIAAGLQAFGDYSQINLAQTQKRNLEQDINNKKALEAGQILKNINQVTRNSKDNVDLEILNRTKEKLIQSTYERTEGLALENSLRSQTGQIREQQYQFNQLMNKLKLTMTGEEIKKLREMTKSQMFQNNLLEYEQQLRNKYGLDPGAEKNITSDLLGYVRTMMKSILGK